jgi:hypothetical protein
MHYWLNPSILKTQSLMGEFKSKRPKGLKDEEWLAMISEFRYNKQIVMNKVPKVSKKDFTPKGK